jgi:glycosyltransferase involved in cell wall biosynthesis
MVENLRWNATTEADDLRQADIGIMPLPDDNWSRGKCGMKALQYMGMGIPTVCSAVGANKEIVHEGENGFLAENEDQWLAALNKLIHSVELRSHIGKNGRSTVLQKYSAEVQAPKVFEVFERAIIDYNK